MIEPMRLSPAFKDYLWGGEKLKTVYNKNTPYDKTAESWELSCHPNGESTVIGGTYDGKTLSEVIALCKEQGMDITGKNALNFDRFPVLNKLIDAKQDLSVQVHPDDAYAFANENGSYGKTEVWYVVDADPGAKLVYGLKRDLTKEEFMEAVNKNTLTDELNFVPAKQGDVFFVPAGKIHAIGPGLLICEIQQNSDTTYRVYDWGRVDKDGKGRPLHVEKAAAVSDLSKETKTDFSPKVLEEKDGVKICEVATCNYFTAKQYTQAENATLKTDESSFLSITFVKGEGSFSCGNVTMDFQTGDSFYFAAQEAEIEIKGSCTYLTTTV